jgi:hypothetical protein
LLGLGVLVGSGVLVGGGVLVGSGVLVGVPVGFAVAVGFGVLVGFFFLVGLAGSCAAIWKAGSAAETLGAVLAGWRAWLPPSAGRNEAPTTAATVAAKT